MNIKEAYYYLFYKLYKFGERSLSIFPSKYTALNTIGSLFGLLLLSLKFYYADFINRNVKGDFFSFDVLIPIIAFFLVNYFAFFDDDKWKEYIIEIENWPRKKNIAGTW